MTKLEKANTIGFYDLNYDTQWLIFNKAVMFGWAGHKPGVFGTFTSDQALDNALDWLIEEKVQFRKV